MENTEKTKATEITRVFISDKVLAAKKMARVLIAVDDNTAKGLNMWHSLNRKLREGLAELYERNTGKRLPLPYADVMATLLAMDAAEEAFRHTDFRFDREAALQDYAEEIWESAFKSKCTKEEFLEQFPGVVAVAEAKLAIIS